MTIGRRPFFAIMKVLFASFKYEYGRPEWGTAMIEYQNFFGTLSKMQNIEASFFAVDEVLAEVGRDEMNKRLIKAVEEQRPDLLFTVIFQDEIKKETINYITKQTRTKTFNWFTDDHWRLFTFSRYWAPLFTAVGTTDSLAPAKYKSYGINNVIKTQWAANTALFHPEQLSANSRQLTANTITFVGKNYGVRQKYIDDLQKKGLPAKGYGKGWGGGLVSQEKMLEIFSGSKINLNFTEGYFNWPKQLAKLFIKKESGKYSSSIQHLPSNIRSLVGAGRRQIKARTFEIPACGGFLLSGKADNLSDYYIPGKEIEIFADFDELAEKCEYYLEHEPERAAIAKAGYERTISDHTYEKRFNDIFIALGLI